MRTTGWAVLFQLGIGAGLAAQQPPGRFTLGLSIGTMTHTGAAGSENPAEDVVFVPYRPTMYGLHAGIGRGGLRLELTAKYGEPGLAIRGEPDPESTQELMVLANNVFKLTTLGAAGSVPLVRLRGGPVLRVGAGLVLERWTSAEFEARTLLAVHGSMILEVELLRRLAAQAEAGLGVSASPFHRGDLPEGYATRAVARRLLSVGLSWRP